MQYGCLFFTSESREFGECGEFRESKELVKLEECNSDIGNHLSRCHLSREVLTEGDLMMARAGFFSPTQTQKRVMVICAKH